MYRICTCGHAKTAHNRRVGFLSFNYEGDLYLECLKCGLCGEYNPLDNLEYLEFLHKKKVNKI